MCGRTPACFGIQTPCPIGRGLSREVLFQKSSAVSIHSARRGKEIPKTAGSPAGRTTAGKRRMSIPVPRPACAWERPAPPAKPEPTRAKDRQQNSENWFRIARQPKPGRPIKTLSGTTACRRREPLSAATQRPATPGTPPFSKADSRSPLPLRPRYRHVPVRSAGAAAPNDENHVPTGVRRLGAQGFGLRREVFYHADGGGVKAARRRPASQRRRAVHRMRGYPSSADNNFQKAPPKPRRSTPSEARIGYSAIFSPSSVTVIWPITCPS